MILLIDNYDSFTFNLMHRLSELGAGDIEVVRNDGFDVAAVCTTPPRAIVLSPGPCDPDRAGLCLSLVAAAHPLCPMLGVCLGHQVLVQHFGGAVVPASRLMHGKVDGTIRHKGVRLFEGLESPLEATRYHSLTVDPASIPEVFEIDATADDGTVMAVSHKTLPLFGVQFHPESIATPAGHKILGNFLTMLEA